jgi:hypothetical protein
MSGPIRPSFALGLAWRLGRNTSSTPTSPFGRENPGAERAEDKDSTGPASDFFLAGPILAGTKSTE